MATTIIPGGENTFAAQLAAATAETARIAAETARDTALSTVPSDNTLALRSAIRNYGIMASPAHRLEAANVATITVGGSSSAINSNNSSNCNVSRTSSKLQWPSGPGALGGAFGTANVPRGSWDGSAYGHTTYNAVEFSHNGSTFEIPVHGSGASGTNFRVLVNDTEAGTSVFTATGSIYYVKVTFPSSKVRRIRIETAGVPIYGVNVSSTTEVSNPNRAYPLAAIMGDSFVEGTGTVLNGIGSEATLMGRLLGWDIALAGLGGTGILNPASSPTKVNFADTTRLLDLTLSGVTDARTGAAVDPKIGVVMVSLNDNGYTSWSTFEPSATSFQYAITRRVYRIIDAWAATRNGKPLVFFGPTNSSSNSPPLDLFRIRDGVQEAVFGFGGASQNVWFIDRFAPGPVLRQGIYTTSTDQAFLYTAGSGDPTHPNQAGHNLDGIWMAQQLRSLILTEFN